MELQLLLLYIYNSPMKKFIKLSLILLIPLLISGCNFFQTKNSGLQVITNDISSSVFLDGQYLEKTPYIGKEFQPGVYTLRIQPDDPNLVPYETSIHLTAGLLTVVTWKPGERPETSGGVIYEMENLATKKQTELSIISLPDSAIVSIDDGAKQFTPVLLDAIEPGEHEFEVTIPSYETQRHTINVLEGHRMNVTVKLAKTISDKEDETEEEETEVKTIDELATNSATTASDSATPAPLRQALDQPLSGPFVTINSTNFFVDGKEVLRARDEASPAGEEVGFAEVGAQYQYLNETYNGWYKIQLNEDTIGWVSGQYSKLEN